MSGCSDSKKCPVCGEEMSTYSDYKPFDMVDGRCINCGFSYYTRAEQMDLEEVNDLREEEELKPLTEEDLKKWSKDIDNLW